jgi:disulfide bond formation protein DsbB
VDAEQLATFFAFLLLGGAVAGVIAVAVPGFRRQVTESALPLAAVVAVGAMAGSLYFSESAGYVPCELCWYQRIAMYPTAVITLIAAVTGDRRIWRYVIPLSAAGLVVALYHVQLQLFPDQSTFCDAVNPCSGKWVEAFGWMTIPQMSGIAFALILGLALLSVLGSGTIGAHARESVSATTDQENQ